MAMSDPIADMLTRIRNANTAKHKDVLIPMSSLKKGIADILLSEGYIKDVRVVKGEKNREMLKIVLKYKDEQRVISGLKKISKPGLRVYAGKDELPKVLGGLGTAVISTNKGVITDKEARKSNVGGEVLAFIW